MDENVATCCFQPTARPGAAPALTGYVRQCPTPRHTAAIVPMSHPESGSRWVVCRQFGNELEASIAVAILDASGIPAVVRNNDSVGLFGGGFQGFTAMGVSLMVPSAALEAARTALALAANSARPEHSDDDDATGSARA
jgi:Putative prokaryotic signal transducing protein